MLLSNIYVVCPLTFPEDCWAGRELSPEHRFCCLAPFPSIPTAGVSKGVLKKGRSKRHPMRIMLMFTFTVSVNRHDLE